jgi:nicotinamide-nucleotide amidase
VSARAAIVVTGTEVLQGRVSDRNGPWLSEQLSEFGVDVAAITVVGDRPEDMRAALEAAAGLGVALIVTSGGLGPTADDLTAAVVGEFAGRAMVLDSALEARIGAITAAARRRWAQISPETIAAADRKQATIPEGATILEPVGTAPGLVVPPHEGRSGPTVVVLPGPPRELQPMWAAAIATAAFAAAVPDRVELEQRMLRLYGIPESEIATTLRAAVDGGVALDAIEVTTCMRRGEIEIVSRFEPAQAGVYDAFEAVVRAHHAAELFSDDGSSVDAQVAALLVDSGRSVAVAESCTGGLVAARLTDRPGASAYVLGGVVAYTNAAKDAIVGVPADLLAAHGAVSSEVALALADGARGRFGSDVGVGVTGIAGPDGGSPEKPVGLVWLAASDSERQLIVRADLPGRRADVRDRATTVAMHLLRRLLLGEGEARAGGA